MFGENSKYTACMNNNPEFNSFDEIEKAVLNLNEV